MAHEANAERSGGTNDQDSCSNAARFLESKVYAETLASSQLLELQVQIEALRSELAQSSRENEAVSLQLEQSKLVSDALNDALTTAKLRCAHLEANEKQHERRIAELHARIDEQRGELNRAYKASSALQKSIEALTSHTLVS